MTTSRDTLNYKLTLHEPQFEAPSTLRRRKSNANNRKPAEAVRERGILFLFPSAFFLPHKKRPGAKFPGPLETILSNTGDRLVAPTARGIRIARTCTFPSATKPSFRRWCPLRSSAHPGSRRGRRARHAPTPPCRKRSASCGRAWPKRR